jgi:hypothetical protein
MHLISIKTSAKSYFDGIKFGLHISQNILGGSFYTISAGEIRTVWPRDITASQVTWPISLSPTPEARP